ncbi:MAG: response regulator [Anaerolinea sp.]|nr:response regulator [Anaerolinea sp.]
MAQLVLIVDDESMTRDLLRMMLTPVGYEICEAEDGEEALQKIEATPPDIVLLDVMMPNMDGLTLCHHLRGHQATAQLPIIMLSAKTNFNSIEEGLNAGANKYLTKPIARKVLLATIQELLGS